MTLDQEIKLFGDKAKTTSSEELRENAVRCIGFAVVICHTLQERLEAAPFDPDVLIALLESINERCDL